MPRKKRERVKFPSELCDEAFERGDAFEMFQTIVDAPFAMVDLSEQFPRLHSLIRQNAKTNPLGFAQNVIDQGIATIGFMAMRLQLTLHRRLLRHDVTFARNNGEGVPPDVLERIMPLLVGLYRHLGDMGETKARLARQAELARAKKLENDLEELMQPAKLADAVHELLEQQQAAVDAMSNAEATVEAPVSTADEYAPAATIDEPNPAGEPAPEGSISVGCALSAVNPLPGMVFNAAE